MLKKHVFSLFWCMCWCVFPTSCCKLGKAWQCHLNRTWEFHNRQRECLHSSNSETKHGHVVLSIVARVLFVSSGNGKPSRLNMFILGGDFDNKFSCICEGQLWRVHIACNVYIFLGQFCPRYWILENSYRTEIHYFHIPNNIIMVKGWIPNFFYKRLLAVN